MNATVEELAMLKESVIGYSKDEIAEIIETDSPIKVIPTKKKKSVNFKNNDVVIEEIEEDIYVEDFNDTEVKRSLKLDEKNENYLTDNTKQSVVSKVAPMTKVKKSGVLRPISARNKDKPEK